MFLYFDLLMKIAINAIVFYSSIICSILLSYFLLYLLLDEAVLIMILYLTWFIDGKFFIFYRILFSKQVF